MKSIFRFAFLLSLPLLLSIPSRAASVDDNLPNAQALLALELRAQQANPKPAATQATPTRYSASLHGRIC